MAELLNAWADRSGVPVDLTVIPNVGYGPTLQTRLQGGEAFDAFYNFTYNSTKFLDEGWAQNLADLPQVQDMINDMYPAARPRFVAEDGRVLAVPYFSAVHLLHYNSDHLTRAGFAGVPQTLQEVYDQSKKLKDSGVSKYPYVGYWIKEFAEEYLITYLLAEGITPFDEQGQPVFQDDPKTQGVFEWWFAMFRDGLTSPTMLSDDPIKLATFMATGDSSFYVLHHYFLKIIQATENAPQASNVTLAYRMPGAAGKTLHMGEVVQMGGQVSGRARDDTWDLLRYYGWKDESGGFPVLSKWAETDALCAPYPAFFQDSAIIESFGPSYDMAQLSQVFETGSEVVPARRLAWYSQFQVQVGDRIHEMLLGNASPSDTMKALADDARSSARGI